MRKQETPQQLQRLLNQAHLMLTLLLKQTALMQ
jgi:hypothetical protein